MPKIASFISLGIIRLDREGPLSLRRQIYETLRESILSGRLKPGTRLPSTRALAQELDIARNTVSNAYEQLLAEGYLESKTGSGTRVTSTLPEDILNVRIENIPSPKPDANTNIGNEPLHLSERGLATCQIPYPWEKTQLYTFSPVIPAIDEFPFKLWERLLVSSWRQLDGHQLVYPSSLGYRPLREAIANYLHIARGVHCEPEQVIITNGAQQAHSTAANLLLNPGEAVWLENPSYAGIKAALRGALADIIPISVDDQGLVVEEGLTKAPHARLVFISPSHQYPLGVTMSLTRRLKLLEWANNEKAWIIEDDYDSEYRYAGDPLEALQGLDRGGRVIYVGTFSKVLFPALRIGYMIVPPDLIEPVHAARAHADRGATLLEQVVLTQFINEGHLARHIRRMRKLYSERQKVFIEMAEKYLTGLIEVQQNDTGLHLVGWLPEGVDDRQVSQKLHEHGFDVPPYSLYKMTPASRSGLVIGYGAMPIDDMITGIKRMKPILEGCVV